MSEYNHTDELTHYGIPGQKWGLRRYQNKDGSLTAAGRKRVAKMKDEYTQLTGKKLIRKPTKKTTTQNDTNERVKKKRIKDMTDTEIKDMISRLDNERTLAKLQAETASTSDKFKRSVVNDVIAPAARTAAKDLLETTLKTIGKKALKLDNDNKVEAVDEILKELRVEDETLRLRKQIYENKKYFEGEKTKQNKTESKKKNEETINVTAEWMGGNTDKSSNSTKSNTKKVYDVEETTRSLVPYKKRKKK